MNATPRVKPAWTGEEILAAPLKVSIGDRVVQDLLCDNPRRVKSAESLAWLFLNTRVQRVA